VTIAVRKCLATLRTARRIWCTVRPLAGEERNRGGERKGKRRSTHRVGHVRGVGVVDDGRERAVVVEEDDDLLAPGRRHDLLERAQRRRVLRLQTGLM
jgi:hypothetical protein